MWSDLRVPYVRCCRGDFVIVGDLMKSITLLFYKAAEGALEVRLRQHGTAQPPSMTVRASSSCEVQAATWFASLIVTLASLLVTVVQSAPVATWLQMHIILQSV